MRCWPLPAARSRDRAHPRPRRPRRRRRGAGGTAGGVPVVRPEDGERVGPFRARHAGPLADSVCLLRGRVCSRATPCSAPAASSSRRGRGRSRPTSTRCGGCASSTSSALPRPRAVCRRPAREARRVHRPPPRPRARLLEALDAGRAAVTAARRGLVGRPRGAAPRRGAHARGPPREARRGGRLPAGVERLSASRGVAVHPARSRWSAAAALAHAGWNLSRKGWRRRRLRLAVLGLRRADAVPAVRRRRVRSTGSTSRRRRGSDGGQRRAARLVLRLAAARLSRRRPVVRLPASHAGSDRCWRPSPRSSCSTSAVGARAARRGVIVVAVLSIATGRVGSMPRRGRGLFAL